MRVNRLDLIRYGRFENACIHFGQRKDDQSDVTIIYGPNEAGKSTAYHAFLDLLFGFRGGSHPYDFRFKRSDLLVGAELELPGRGTIVYRRNSKKTQSLLDTDERPVDEAVLTASLHGLSRDKYEERFSLNEQGLREGGDRIAGAQGDLGQLLHAGISGITGMAVALDKLDERADKFHKKNARKTVLKDAKARIEQIKKDLADSQLTTRQEKKLRQQRERAEEEFNVADHAGNVALKRLAAAKAATVCFKQSELINQITKELSKYPDGPELTAEAADTGSGLIEKIESGTARIKELEINLAAQQSIVSENPEDELAKSLDLELKYLDGLKIDNAPLLGRASSARTDIAVRATRVREIEKEIGQVQRKLGIPEVSLSSLKFEQGFLDKLTDAERQHSDRHMEARAATEALNLARQQRGDQPQEPQDLTTLREAFHQWKSTSDLSIVENDKTRCAEQLIRAAAGLPDNWQDLIAAGFPAKDRISQISRQWTELNAALPVARQELSDCENELNSALAELSAMQSAPEAIDITVIEQTRRERDTLWQQHKGDLSADSAEVFEAAMVADDSARSHYLTGAEARQRLLTAQQHSRSTEKRLHAARGSHDQLVNQHRDISERTAQLARSLGLDADTPVTAFQERHQQLSAAADAAADLTNAENALQSAIGKRDSALADCQAAAMYLGFDSTRSDFSSQVERTLTLEDSIRKTWNQWLDKGKAIEKLESDVRQKQDALAESLSTLNQLTSTLPLSDRSASVINALLPELRALQSLCIEHEKLLVEIHKLEGVIAELEAGSKRLTVLMKQAGSELSEEPEPVDTQSNANPAELSEPVADPLQIINKARVRVARATDTQQKRNHALELIDQLEKEKLKVESERDNAQVTLDRFFHQQGGEQLSLRDRLRDLLDRDRQRNQLATAKQNYRMAKDEVDPELFTEELELMPDASRVEQLEQLFEDAKSVRDKALRVLKDAEDRYDEALNADERSDLLTEQATLLEELRDSARQAMVARLGSMAARSALRRLAQERRSSMLQDVEDAFVTMTAPDWSGVDIWSESAGEKLVGRKSDGAPVPVDQMSTGTMGQLYFALRLAGYRSFAREPGPLPMVLDDIMETFDDNRARAALRLCEEIGSIGQSILFTHHAHLLELARDTIDAVNVVNIPA